MIKGRFKNIVDMGKHRHNGIEGSANISCMWEGAWLCQFQSEAGIEIVVDYTLRLVGKLSLTLV